MRGRAPRTRGPWGSFSRGARRGASASPSIRMLCDWLVVSQVLPVNPAAAGCGGRSTSSPRGRRRSWTQAEARKLLEHIDTGTLAGLRDRALFSVML